MNRRTFARRVLGLPFLSAALQPASANEKVRGIRPGVKTFTHSGKEEQPFLNDKEAQLAWQEGAGYLDHIWFGGAFEHYLRIKLRVYVDGEAVPSIEMELGMGAGIGYEDMAAPWGTRHAGLTGAPSGIFYNYRIPFGRSVRVTAQLPDGVARDQVFWWIIRGLENHAAEACGFLLPLKARLKLHKLENYVAQPLEEFELARVPGAGLVFQVAMAAESTNLEFMEGRMRAYFGQDPKPQFLSSGLEDYFLGTYYFNRGLYHFAQAGLTHKSESDNSFSAYRVHDEDPLVFADGIRLVCRCGEQRGEKTFGTTGHPMATTYTTYVWTYEW
jgi:hypothetical protein